MSLFNLSQTELETCNFHLIFPIPDVPMSHVRCHISGVECQVSHVTCHESCVMCNLSFVMRYVSYVICIFFYKVAELVG